MQNTISCHQVADFFLLQIDQNAGDTISNLKLQKICYYAQAWHLANYKRPLFGDRIEAWAHGPVVVPLYHRFKQFRWDAIDPSRIKTNPYEDLHEEQLDFLSEIWEKYGALTAKKLERLSHSEDPWKIAYGDRPAGHACDEEITHDMMIAYYGQRAEFDNANPQSARATG